MDIKAILQQYWGYSKFRVLQEDIILSVVDGKDTLALLPTGGGKSICFQVPTLAMEGLCLVVSPLIALMKDQVENLLRRNIAAAAIHTGLHPREVDMILNRCKEGKIKFLYVSPERLKNTLFKNSLSEINICLLAVDEAHCVSQWGYDFRPPYLEIAEIRQELPPSVPVLALTATATPDVVIDIQKKLAFKEERVFKKSFIRDNLTYFVLNEENKLNKLLHIAQRTPGTGIVYVRNRKKTQEIAHLLANNKHSADFYHAGLSMADRNRKQNNWTSGKTRIIVATNAFGMGIDKPDVRFVVHLDLPDTLEAYFQEAGRGGRDEKRSYAILLYENADILNLQKNFEISYPPLSFIVDVYQALVNYFRIPMGYGEGLSYEFDNSDFANTYKFNPLTTYHALKFIEQTGLITFTDPYSNSSKIHINTTREDLYKFQVEHAAYDPMIKLLLRSYSGLFSNFTRINENDLAKRIHKDVDFVVEILKKLQQFEILIYEQQTEKPRIIFLENRIETKHLVISDEIYNTRKEKAKEKTDAVIQYVTNQTKCRSSQLVAYFGETESIRCGKCDICLKRNKIELSALEFDNILDVIKPLLQKNETSVEELVNYARYPEEKIVKVVRWLLDNDKIIQTPEKKLHWHSK
ncbi:MAG: RecQ family ATP-dependent DNA helicase [Bacteroidales bacterium]|nr:RecQ family ATP-dependent DNA helicase [Bacteroidales bacterium]